jgi:hypothetical protein
MIARCAEEETLKTFSIAINVDIAGMFPNRENINAIKMLPNPSVLYAWMYLNTRLNTIKVSNVAI